MQYKENGISGQSSKIFKYSAHGVGIRGLDSSPERLICITVRSNVHYVEIVLCIDNEGDALFFSYLFISFTMMDIVQ